MLVGGASAHTRLRLFCAAPPITRSVYARHISWDISACLLGTSSSQAVPCSVPSRLCAGLTGMQHSSCWCLFSLVVRSHDEIIQSDHAMYQVQCNCMQ